MGSQNSISQVADKPVDSTLSVVEAMPCRANRLSRCVMDSRKGNYSRAGQYHHATVIKAGINEWHLPHEGTGEKSPVPFHLLQTEYTSNLSPDIFHLVMAWSAGRHEDMGMIFILLSPPVAHSRKSRQEKCSNERLTHKQARH